MNENETECNENENLAFKTVLWSLFIEIVKQTGLQGKKLKANRMQEQSYKYNLCKIKNILDNSRILEMFQIF